MHEIKRKKLRLALINIAVSYDRFYINGFTVDMFHSLSAYSCSLNQAAKTFFFRRFKFNLTFGENKGNYNSDLLQIKVVFRYLSLF